ncbi:hypothetical protein AGMMS50239_29550 [Bacteroidia bacterium]|nr:hypothetical protein AGMMS50239_29550 [Bacteroidia bacterium]
MLYLSSIKKIAGNFIIFLKKFSTFVVKIQNKMKTELIGKISPIKKISLLLFFISFCFCTVQAQIEIQSVNAIEGTGFKTCFIHEKSGNFPGSLSGVLRLVKNGSKDVLTYNFRNEESDLRLVYDENEIYDVSRKNYIFRRNDIKLRYTTYFWANCFEIILNGDTCFFDVIDGGCGFVIDGINWQYDTSDDRELLSLTFTKDVGLWQRGKRISSYVVKAGSKLLFNISRKKSRTW